LTRRSRSHRNRGQGRAGVRPPVQRSAYIDRKLAPMSVLSDEGLELIEANADLILQQTGMEFHDDPEILPGGRRSYMTSNVVDAMQRMPILSIW